MFVQMVKFRQSIISGICFLTTMAFNYTFTISLLILPSYVSMPTVCGRSLIEPANDSFIFIFPKRMIPWLRSISLYYSFVVSIKSLQFLFHKPFF